jgi:hypothetical protein
MNIDDVNRIEDVAPEERWPTIFAHQRKLMEKYDEIEREAGANVPEAPWSLDDKRVQWRLKDLFWRVTEELAEALEFVDDELLLGWEEKWAESADVRHVFEELADALHFLVEASIVGDDNAELTVRELDRDVRFSLAHYEETDHGRMTLRTKDVLKHKSWDVVYRLGLAANTLKNKPWKQTHMPTDVWQFKGHLWEAWKAFLRIWVNLGCSQEQVFGLYFRKMKVNQFRQRTQY